MITDMTDQRIKDMKAVIASANEKLSKGTAMVRLSLDTKTWQLIEMKPVEKRSIHQVEQMPMIPLPVIIDMLVVTEEPISIVGDGIASIIEKNRGWIFDVPIEEIKLLTVIENKSKDGKESKFESI